MADYPDGLPDTLKPEWDKVVAERDGLKTQHDTLLATHTAIKAKHDEHEAKVLVLETQLKPVKDELTTWKDKAAQLEAQLKGFSDQSTALKTLQDQLADHQNQLKIAGESIKASNDRYVKQLTSTLTLNHGIDAKKLEGKTIEQLEAIVQALPEDGTKKSGLGLGDGTGHGSGPVTALQAAQMELEKLGVK